MVNEALLDHMFRTHGSDETRALAEQLGRLLSSGDTLSLTGDLGAGKTTFTQGLAAGLEIPAGVVVNSPTFTILAEHREGRVPLYHFDVYRLSGPDDLYDLAFDEYADGSGVVVIEWADKIADALPGDTLFIAIEMPSDGSQDDRDVSLRASGPRSVELVNALTRSWREAQS